MGAPSDYWDRLFADDTDGYLGGRDSVREELADAHRLGAEAAASGVEIDLDEAKPIDIYELFATVTGRDYRAGHPVDERYVLDVAGAYERGARAGDGPAPHPFPTI